MRIEELLNESRSDVLARSACEPAAPASPGVVAPESEGLAEPSAPQESQYNEETTPNGTVIHYEWAPRRLYRLNDVEVPSVTSVLGVLDKSGPLVWWSQGVACEGVIELVRRGKLVWVA